MKTRVAELIIRFRWPILIIAVIITAAFATLLPKLEADDDVLQFLPAVDPDIALFHRVNEKFGGLDVAIVGLEADDMFTAERLTEIRELTRRLARVEGVYDVMSFTEVPDPQPGPVGLNVEPLVDSVPTDPAELEALRARVLANKNAVGNLISRDGEAAMILCFLGGKRAAVNVAADIKTASSKLWTGKGIYYAGSPFIRLHVVGGTKTDMSKLTPVVIIVVTLITFLLFPKPLGVVLSLSVVGMALVWTLGLFVLLGKKITIVDSSIPTLFVAIGGAYGIHFLGAYFTGAAPTIHGRIVEAFRERVGPVSFSAFATCAGFAAFQAMNVGPMREFGWLCALGILFMLLLALTVIPAAMSFSRNLPTRLGAAPLARSLGRLGSWSLGHRRGVIAGAAVLAAVSVVCAARVEPDSTLRTFYADGSEPDEANKFLERRFGGSVMLQIYFEGDMRSPFVLAELRKIVEYLQQDDNVVQVSSIIDPLVMMAEAMGGRPDLPISQERTQPLYPFIEGSAAIDQIISPTKEASLVQVRLKNLPPEMINAAVDGLQAFVAKEIPHAVSGIEVRKLPPKDRERQTEAMIGEISARLVRLIDIHGRERAAQGAERRIAAAIREHGMKEDLVPGPDVAQAVDAMIAEHVMGEGALFMEPEPDADAEAAAEWVERERRLRDPLGEALRGSPDLATVTDALRNALPLTAARDPKGLELSADALATAMADARAMIEATRLAAPVLAAAGVSAPPAELERRIAWALTDLDAPAFGLPSEGPQASKVAAFVTGQPVVNAAFADCISRNTIASLIVTFVLLIALLTIAFRSIVVSLKALVPALVMFAVAIGVMGAVKIPLDPTTNMISAIALGVGVDYAIHFLWRRRRRRESLQVASETIGPSIASNAIQVAAGFSVLAISDMIPMQRFGLLVALTMILCAVATFVLLPVLKAEGSLPDLVDSRAPAHPAATGE
ncbi:MAG: MMPL family transporter [Proteobacteria bacterium]|jgi:predicted RND superfamily exporter protein|nr:MMPL family transporter [Pseudomonadota bacterium]